MGYQYMDMLINLIVGSDMCTQVSSPVSKLEIPRKLVFVFFFPEFSGHILVRK